MVRIVVGCVPIKLLNASGSSGDLKFPITLLPAFKSFTKVGVWSSCNFPTVELIVNVSLFVTLILIPDAPTSALALSAVPVVLPMITSLALY